jgi:hypothetical protein
MTSSKEQPTDSTHEWFHPCKAGLLLWQPLPLNTSAAVALVQQYCCPLLVLEAHAQERSAGVQVWRQAWGVAGTSPPHTVLVR